MALSTRQYQNLNKQQRLQKLQEIRLEKIQVLGVYYNQSDEILQYLDILPDSVFSKESLMIEELGRLDPIIEEFNPQIYPALIAAITTLGVIGLDHANETFNLAGFNNYQSLNIIDIIRKIENLKPINGFKLSTAIWSKDKRDEVYKTIIDGIRLKENKREIQLKLETYLKEPGKKGFYNTERIIDTELQRAYSTAKLESTRNFNNTSGSKFLIKQSLSPFHKGYDICDVLAGTYDPSGSVPEIPRHPFCMCDETLVQDKDNKSNIKELSGSLITPNGFKTSVRLL